MGAGSTYKLGSVTNAALGGRRGSFLSSSSGLKTSRLKKPGRGLSVPGASALPG